VLTIFSCPKPFRGHINIIQRNAICSWILLQPRPEIILIGDEEGTAEVCKELGLCHISEIERNEYGTPLINSIFHTAQAASSNPFLCYVNADIIFVRDFMEAVRLFEASNHRCLIVGRRWDIDLKQAWDFEKPDWEAKLKAFVRQHGKLHARSGIDYFVFSSSTIFFNIPPFAIGRIAWDNWFIYKARSLQIPVIDATEALMVIHQNHDYSPHSGGEEDVRKGPEAKYNLKLVGGTQYLFDLADATHVLTKKGLKQAFDLVHIWRRLYRLPVFYPLLIPLRWLLSALLIISRSVRMKIGLTLERFS
jgi:hypothetical protein